jgi:hypothetical protein
MSTSLKIFMRPNLISWAVSRPVLYPEGNPAGKRKYITKINYNLLITIHLCVV